MRSMIFAFLLLPFAAFALPAPQAPARPYELMKCTSSHNGTIWASFGRMMRSGEDQLIYFPTEIVLFSKDMDYRWVLPSLEDALQIEMNVRTGGFRFAFEAKKEGVTRKHLLQARVVDPRDSHAFMGNWTVSQEGQEDRMDLVSCSLD